ncbi:hypothetical protein, partial [Mycobacterium tuberculosis]
MAGTRRRALPPWLHVRRVSWSTTTWSNPNRAAPADRSDSPTPSSAVGDGRCAQLSATTRFLQVNAASNPA